MKKILMPVCLIFLIACSSNSDKNKGNVMNLHDPLSGFNVNTMITRTVMDSIPFAAIPYADSISVADNLPLRQIHISGRNIEFLKIKKLREFSDLDRDLPDSLFSFVCRLDLSPNFYSVIINYNNTSETMNYLINYDIDFHVIDYLQTCYEQIADVSERITSTIDTAGIAVCHSNIMSAPADNRIFFYTVSSDGFFREMPDDLTAGGN